MGSRANRATPVHVHMMMGLLYDPMLNACNKAYERLRAIQKHD